MKRFSFALLTALFLAPSITLAADQQVDPDVHRRAGVNPFYKRSDGLHYRKDFRTPSLIGNGDGYSPLGATYYEDFSYGDGLGILCESTAQVGTSGFSTAASANAACNTTCGNSACVMGFEAALADAGDILACSDATADACLCQTASLDHVLLGCGANWEAPALGVSLMTFASGVKLADVALLAQDIGPDMDASGLDIAQDLTDDDGVEILGGMYGASGRPMVPGVDPAFFFCAEVTFSDSTGSTVNTDEFWVGFRDTTEPNAAFNAYNSYYAVGLDNTSGDVHVEHEDDGGTETTTDITVSAIADDATTKYCVFVSDTGVATNTVEGEAASDNPSYTFDSGEPIIPFVHYLHSSGIAASDAIYISEWVVGYGTEAEVRAWSDGALQ